MNGSSADAQTKALEFVNQGSSYTLFATIAPGGPPPGSSTR